MCSSLPQAAVSPGDVARAVLDLFPQSSMFFTSIHNSCKPNPKTGQLEKRLLAYFEHPVDVRVFQLTVARNCGRKGPWTVTFTTFDEEVCKTCDSGPFKTDWKDTHTRATCPFAIIEKLLPDGHPRLLRDRPT
jgi:hypothetical protein